MAGVAEELERALDTGGGPGVEGLAGAAPRAATRQTRGGGEAKQTSKRNVTGVISEERCLPVDFPRPFKASLQSFVR